MKPKFNPGREVMTRGVSEWCGCGYDQLATERYFKVLECLKRHLFGDWGEVCPEDQESNRVALMNGFRLLSSYTVDDTKIWVITEADRSSTTILFPDEY
jgi:hypothetical protein